MEEAAKKKDEEDERSSSQQNLNFPAKPEDINRDMLSPMNSLTTEDFEQKMRESLEYQKDPEERKAAAQQRQPNHRNK